MRAGFPRHRARSNIQIRSSICYVYAAALPAYREYVTFVATILVTFAVLQYTGIFFKNSGTIDLGHLISVGLILPVTTYLLTVIQANIEWIPQWDRMIQAEE